MRIVYLGEFFKDDKTPMRGIAQSLMREFCRVTDKEYSPTVIYEGYQNHIEFINSADLVFINIDPFYDKNLYEIISRGLIKTKIAAISTELFDICFAKSNYKYFNQTGVHTYNVLNKYGILDKLLFTISGSYRCLRPDIPRIYYPYLYAPSVYEDKISFMRSAIERDIKISTDHPESCCMVYKFPNQYREEVADLLSEFFDIKYGGKWRNNDNRVKFDYHFDITKDYLSNFKFNIAVENDYFPGWYTEKIINPLLVGTVPIYYAPFSFPEIINKEACVVIDDEMLYRTDKDALRRSLDKDRTGISVFSPNASSIFESFLSRQITLLKYLL